jgi:hypothetical protein
MAGAGDMEEKESTKCDETPVRHAVPTPTRE